MFLRKKSNGQLGYKVSLCLGCSSTWSVCKLGRSGFFPANSCLKYRCQVT